MTALRALLLAAFALLVLVPNAGAHSYTHGTIAIGHVWTPPQPDATAGAGVFGAVVNRGDRAVELVGATSPAAGQVRFRTAADGEVRWLDSIRLEPGRPTSLAPWHAHIWLQGLQAPLKAGERIPLILDFGEAGKISVEVFVEEGPSD